ncbi:MAG: MarR family transcriptional regulator [Planctomycetota bacterium]
MPSETHSVTGDARPSEPEGREACLVRNVFVLHNMIMRVGDRLSAEIGLTSSRWLLLCAIGEAEAAGESPTVSALSESALLSAQAVSRMLAAMEGEGLLARSSRPGHGRAVFVSLTEVGRAALEATEELAERFEAGMLRGMSGGEVSRIEGDLARLIDNVNGFEQEMNRCEG